VDAWFCPALSTPIQHLIFPASRAAEYEQRIAGATYEKSRARAAEFSRQCTRCGEQNRKRWKTRALAALRQFAAHGTTTLEAKSGYGLDAQSELAILRLLSELHQEQPIDIHSTFLGAHVVPPSFAAAPKPMSISSPEN